MNLPILQYLDVLIGLAVVMLIVSTVVTAVTQVYLNSLFVRARHLRHGLEDLLGLLLPSLAAEQVRYIVDRLQRHPLIGRRNTIVGRVTGLLRNLVRGWLSKTALPGVNPAATITREELLWMLLEWAAGEGPLARQDKEAAADSKVRDKLREAVQAAGIGDPGAVLRRIRLLTFDRERVAPEQPAHTWRARAVCESTASDLAANLHAWFDNTMARVTEHYTLEARVVVSAVSLAVCLAIQLDSVDLIRRLSRDDKFRATVQQQAERAQKSYEDLLGKPVERTVLAERKAQADQAAQQALDLLREDGMGVIPQGLVWQKVWHVEVPETKLPAGQTVTVAAGRFSRDIAIPAVEPAEGFLRALAASGLPLTAYRDKGRITLVASDPSLPSVTLSCDCVDRAALVRDRLGARARLPGVLLSWILLSLGAPFWYDLLKKLLGLRSLLGRKEEEERKSREEQQAPRPDTVAPAAQPFTLNLLGSPEDVQPAAHARFRSGAPTTASPEAGKKADGKVVSTVGYVKGEALTTASGATEDRWYQTKEGQFLWAGDVQPAGTFDA